MVFYFYLNVINQHCADLIPVSSTVIPLPIYRVETSLNASAGKSSLVKPDGPVTLLTGRSGNHFPLPIFLTTNHFSVFSSR